MIYQNNNTKSVRTDYIYQ